MKNVIIGTFPSKSEAEALLRHLSGELDVPTEDISYIYRNEDGEVEESYSDDDGESTALSATTGAMVGGSVGALAGLATVMGLIPVIGPIFAAGPIVAALGLGAGALGTTAAGALTGAIAGGVIGALVDLGVTENEAEEYQERVRAGEVLVIANTENESEVTGAFEAHGASSVRTYSAVHV